MTACKTVASLLAIIALSCCSGPRAAAATIPAITGLSGGSQGGGFNQTTQYGLRFTPAADISVSALGIYDTSNNGLATEMRVAMFQQTGDFSGVELARVTIPAGTAAPLVDRFRYADLDTPLVLSAGTTYQVATIYFSSGSEGTLNGSSHTIHPLLTNVTRRAVQSDSFTDVIWFNSLFGGTTLGANFLFEVVIPEPTGIALAGLALIGVVGFPRRRIL